MRLESKNVSRINVIWAVQSEGKNFPLCRFPKSAAYPRHPAPHHKGRFAIVTNVGRGMRWTRVAQLTKAHFADGEIAWS